MLQMEDSVAPLIPQGLEGYVDTLGAVCLKWTANTDADLLGYRIYRGQTEGDELIPLTDTAVKTNEYRDSVNLYNLNAKVYYAVAALDKRYNQSAMSATLILEKPDMIKPSPPFITTCEATGKGIQLEWIPGRETLHSYLIFRKEKGERDLLQTVASPDITSYLDSTVAGGITYAYDIVSVNRRQLESDPSPAMTVTAKGKASEIKITRFKGERTEKGILLKWEHTVPDVKSAVIYRKEGEVPLSSWRGLETWERETLDASAKRNVTYEYLLIIKNRDGVPASATFKIN
jgi:fibronectin type 3 domain-containing protein